MQVVVGLNAVVAEAGLALIGVYGRKYVFGFLGCNGQVLGKTCGVYHISQRHEYYADDMPNVPDGFL